MIGAERKHAASCHNCCGVVGASRLLVFWNEKGAIAGTISSQYLPLPYSREV